jgi:streptogramin lyase
MIVSSRQLAILLCAISTIAITGCGVSPSVAPSIAATPLTGSSLRGMVHGGQQPVSNATVQLYAASTSGYAAAATPLIGTTVLSDANGAFSITGTYTCPAGALVYLVATGGNPGMTGTQNNSGLALMAGLGPCSALSGATFISVDERTTVASVWALSPFMSSITHVGTSSTNVQGLTNAFASINELINTATGAVPGPALPTNATLPINEINTLADILAACVNTVDTTSPAQKSSNCTMLFNAATPVSTAPADTIQAALNLSQNPLLALATLNATVTATPPFQPTLGTTAPSSWTMAINYVGGGLSTPKGIATDDSGNVWIANSGNNSVTQLNNIGAAVSGASGFTPGPLSAPSAIAIDANGLPWITNSGNNTVTQLSSNGASGTPFSGGGLNVPKSIAIDATGNIWVTNFGNSSVTELSPTGTALSGANGYTAGGVSQPVAVAVDRK